MTTSGSQKRHQSPSASQSRRLLFTLIAIFCTMLWGSASPAIKLGYSNFNVDTTDPFSVMLFAGVRFFGAGFLTLLLSRIITGQTPRFYVALLKPTITQALLQTIGQYFFFYMGLAVVSGASGALISSTSAFLIVLVSAAIGFEKLTGNKLLGVTLGLIGIVILNLDNTLQLTFRWNGELFVLLSTVCNVFATLAMKHFSKDHEPIALTGYQFLLGGAVLSLIGVAGGGRLIWPGLRPSLVLFYLMLVSALAYGLWNWLIKRNEVSKVVVFHSLTPIFGALFSWLILSENIWRWQLLAALGLIVIGIYILNRKTDRIIEAV